ncbi:MAG: hypothetical protein PHE79_05065 [Eubacteriales bacterium]|nr:hypothetical protein [Eubacteriales bacterium]
MICPNCNNAVILSHVTSTTEIETGETTTHYYYTCLDPRCPSYLKVINGSEEGKEAEIREKKES